mmetsp:Transcript_4631/g.11925  ORF Transcript_4631/g.11925 Transcript_4631/m.11925 type:complete len:307 (-) Transcript_4631:72-992(-)
MESLPTIVRRGHTSSGVPLHDEARAGGQREKQRIRNHASTQTTLSEIIPLKQVQSNLQRMWTEMSAVQAELKFAEQKLRYQMREELQLQINFQEERCNDKLHFMRTKADSHVSQVRKASYAKAKAEIVRHQREDRAAREQQQAAEQRSAEELHAEEVRELNSLQRQYILRLQEMQLENKNLHARIKKGDETLQQKEHDARAAQQRDVQVIASLEQQVTAKEQEIQMLREQLAAHKRQQDAPTAPVAPPALPAGMGGPNSTAESFTRDRNSVLRPSVTESELGEQPGGEYGLHAPKHILTLQEVDES